MANTGNFKNNVIFRTELLALLKELNRKLIYYDSDKDGNPIKRDVPFLISITGSERWLQDQFVYDALENGYAVGDYERVPRCMVSLSGINIDTGDQQNKYIQTQIKRVVNNRVFTLNLNTDFVPVTFSLSCSLICSTNLELFKLTEAIISKVYRTQNLFNIDLGSGLIVQGDYTTPTSYNHQTPQEFGLNDKKEYKMDFELEFKTLLPCFEYGLTLSELDVMLANLPQDTKGIISLRTDDKGNLTLKGNAMLDNIQSGLFHQQSKDVLDQRP